MPLFRASILLALLFGPAHAEGWNVAAMNRVIESANFVVNRGCSGTLIDRKNRYILTAEHCITGQYEIITRDKFKDDGTVVEEKIRRALPGQVQQLTFDGATQTQAVTYRTKIVLTDKDKDLALVQILASSIPNAIAAELACDNPVRGDTAYVVGNPYAVLYSSVTKGVVSSVQRNYQMLGIDDQGEAELMQISGGVVGGNSGGSVFNDRGQLIGVPVRASTINEVIGLAAPLTDVKRFLRRAGLEAELWGDRCETKKTSKDKSD